MAHVPIRSGRGECVTFGPHSTRFVQVGSSRSIPPRPNRPRVGVALGGGAARGFAHAGTLRVLQDAGIEVDLIVGISVGAFVGAMWAFEPDFSMLRSRFSDFLASDESRRSIFSFPSRNEEDERGSVFRRFTGSMRQRYTFGKAMVGRSVLPQEYLNSVARGLVPDRDLAETRIPFACMAVDVRQAREVLFTGGPAHRALLASAAMPGVIPPFEFGERLLVDGAAMGGIPVDACRHLGADVVIGCDVRVSVLRPTPMESGLDLVVRSDSISSYFLTQAQLDRAEVAIQPRIGHLHWSNFRNYEEAFEAGAEATRLKIDQIKEAIELWTEAQARRHSLWSRFRRGLRDRDSTPTG